MEETGFQWLKAFKYYFSYTHYSPPSEFLQTSRTLYSVDTRLLTILPHKALKWWAD